MIQFDINELVLSFVTCKMILYIQKVHMRAPGKNHPPLLPFLLARKLLRMPHGKLVLGYFNALYFGARQRGQPFISEHLHKNAPFLGKGDFCSGSFGHDLIEELQPADMKVEKVAFSAFS